MSVDEKIEQENMRIVVETFLKIRRLLVIATGVTNSNELAGQLTIAYYIAQNEPGSFVP